MNLPAGQITPRQSPPFCRRRQTPPSEPSEALSEWLRTPRTEKTELRRYVLP